MPCTAQAGSLLCQIAWRNANDRFSAEEHGVAGDRPGAIVEHHGQPRSSWRRVGIHDEQVEFGVVGLPQSVWPF